MSWKSFSQNWQTILFEIPRHEKQTRRVVITKWLAFTTIIVHTVNSLFVPAVFISLFIYLGYSGGLGCPKIHQLLKSHAPQAKSNGNHPTELAKSNKTPMGWSLGSPVTQFMFTK